MTTGLVDHHLAFVEALRRLGLPVSVAEGLDAVHAVDALGWADRETLRTAYAATVVKRPQHRPTFDAAFDLFFPPTVGLPEAMGAAPGQQAAGDHERAQALSRDLAGAMDLSRLGERDPGEPADPSSCGPAELGTLDAALLDGIPAPIDTLDLCELDDGELEAMRREIQLLARRLASKVSRQRPSRRRGPLDFRHTVRASMATGGVPLTTVHRPRRPHRTDLVVLCDVSASVARFAQFTLMLVFGLQDHFDRVRVLTFIDHVHDVTDRFTPGTDVLRVMADLALSPGHEIAWRRTDYGRVFTEVRDEHADALGPRTSLLILGDGRSNYLNQEIDVLRSIARTTRAVWWLNPEGRANWGTTDSAALKYAEAVPMLECRNLRQLGDFVHRIA